MFILGGITVLLDYATIADYHVHFWRCYSLARQRNKRRLTCSFLAVLPCSFLAALHSCLTTQQLQITMFISGGITMFISGGITMFISGSIAMFIFGGITVLLDNATIADYHVHFWRYYHVHFWRHYSLARQRKNHKLPCFLSVLSSHFACVFCFIRLLVRSFACLTSSETCFRLYNLSDVLLIKRRILDKTESSIYLYLYYGFYYYFLKRKWFGILFRCFVVFLF